MVAVLVAYANSFNVPFVFDDQPTIVHNSSIQSVQSLGSVLAPPTSGGLTTAGRPLVGLSFALNYALSGERVWSYHAFNLLIHAGAGLLLFGFVRRTLLLPVWGSRFEASACGLALGIAGLWLLHPLQTESVTYIVQRTESLMGLFYFLTLYAFVRSVDGEARHRTTFWLWMAWAACLAGMASKEVMVSAPLMTFFYDRTFVAGSFREAWRRRRIFYFGLSSTWVLLAGLLWSTHGRGGTAGFSASVGWWHYALTQCEAITRYLRLAFWPDALVFDYGFGIRHSFADVWPQALLLVTLAAVTVWALVRRPVWGFVGLWFFALLAPSSSVVPVVTQTMAEHRVYVALAAPLAVVVFFASQWFGRGAGWILAGAALACGVTTVVRNFDYRTERNLWRDALAKYPSSARANYNFSIFEGQEGRWKEVAEHCRRAIDLAPGYVDAYNNLGVALMELEQLGEAERMLRAALELRPDNPEAENNLGKLLAKIGRADEAAGHFQAALRLRPDFAEAHNNYGNLLGSLGRLAEAGVEFERSLAIKPDYAEAQFNWGNTCAQAGQMADAVTHYDQAIRLRSDYAEPLVNRGNALLELGRLADAADSYGRALTINPALGAARKNRAYVLARLGHYPEAEAEYRRVLEQNPSDGDVQAALAGLRR